jgi:hypothetical protein
MQWAPSFYLGFGYWMASSKQLYSNNLSKFNLATDPVASGHLITSVFTSEGWGAPAWPLLLAFIVVTTINIFGDFLMT